MNAPHTPLAVMAPRALRHAPPHPVALTGLRAAGDREATAPPRLVERRDADFVEGLLADLQDPARHAALKSPLGARLFQPVQRVFNCLVMEAFCVLPGQPRIDPKMIDSSGFVLRRVRGAQHLAWLKAGTKVFGWEAVDEDLDPAADRRAAPVSLGHPELDRRTPSWQRTRSGGSARLAASAEPVSEDVQPLFLAPPEVQSGAGRTLLFGTLRIAPGELAEMPQPAPAFGTDDGELDLLKADLSPFLQAGGPYQIPLAHRSLAAAELSAADRVALAGFMGLLQQLNNEFGAFGETPAAQSLRQALAPLRVERDGLESDAWSFFVQAKAALVDAVDGARVLMPERLRTVSTAQAKTIFDATLACLRQQYAQVLPAPGRFDAPGRGPEPQFVVRAFVRLKPEHPGCATRLVWSAPSAPFTIAPWFESSGAAVPVIPMPDLFDKAQLAKVRPSVAFALPPKLAALLRDNKAEDLMEGKGDEGDGLGLGWICSFSLPIITLCAFIVLNIFLQLLALIFFWLPFLKICLPIPKAKD